MHDLVHTMLEGLRNSASMLLACNGLSVIGLPNCSPYFSFDQASRLVEGPYGEIFHPEYFGSGQNRPVHMLQSTVSTVSHPYRVQSSESPYRANSTCLASGPATLNAI